MIDANTWGNVANKDMQEPEDFHHEVPPGTQKNLLSFTIRDHFLAEVIFDNQLQVKCWTNGLSSLPVTLVKIKFACESMIGFTIILYCRKKSISGFWTNITCKQ